MSRFLSLPETCAFRVAVVDVEKNKTLAFDWFSAPTAASDSMERREIDELSSGVSRKASRGAVQRADAIYVAFGMALIPSFSAALS